MSKEFENIKDMKQFDNLLKEAFLNLDFDNPKNEILLNALSHSVMATNNYQGTSNVFKELISKIRLQSIILATTFLSIIIICFLYFKNNSSDTSRVLNPLVTEIKKESTNSNLEVNGNSYVKSENTNSNSLKSIQNESRTDMNLVFDSTKISPPSDINLPEYTEPIIYNNTSITTEKRNDSTYVFPKLTEKEIKANNKQKRKMAEQLIKFNKKQYSFIPLGSVLYNGKPKSIGEFYMQNHEVTNLEYRTFLFDLLTRNEKEAFLKAKPNQSLWINCTGNHFYDNFRNGYFSDKAFNDYPVVNISVEGAQMYCNWLSEIVNELSKSKNDPLKELKVQIPKEEDWVYSAKAGIKRGSYPWGSDSIQNSKNVFLANFCAQKLKEQFRQPIVYPFKTNPMAFTSGGYALNNDTVSTVMVYAYNPNDYGLYCMSGNVSEWVISDDLKTVKALGGNWGSDFEHLRINSESEFKERIIASPFIGFRPMIFLKK